MVKRLPTSFLSLCGIIFAVAGTASHASNSTFFVTLQQSTSVSTSPYTYADLAARAERATVIADAKIKSVTKMEKPFAGIHGTQVQRLYVEAEITNLIRSNQAAAKQIGYLVDVPLDSRGKLPKLKKQRVIIFAKPVDGKPGILQLVSPNAQIIWDSTSDARVRSIAAELLNTNAPPNVTNIDSAFHAAGTLEGEGDTQIFLGTSNGNPASLSVRTRPGVEPTWAVAFGEVVSESSQVPEKESLAWYRLACGLPESIPPTAYEGNHEDRRIEIQRDYNFVKTQLGPCTRNLPTI